MKYRIETLGCQMNVCESDNIIEKLNRVGAIKTNNTAEADLIILNTCSVRAQAEQKAFSFLGRAIDAQKKRKDIKIVVIGCMAQRLGDKIKKRFKGIDLIIGSLDNQNVGDKIVETFIKNEGLALSKDILSKNEELNNSVSTYVPIMRGCDNYCSYCVVPFTRGHQESIHYETIVEQCHNLADKGVKEVILLGQNVNSYLYENVNFAALIAKINAIDKIKRIRFMTNHPKDLSVELIEMAASSDKICRHFHLPMQSASDNILKLMNRKYTYENYSNLINLLRDKIPSVSITTDIIVGFPDETESDFNKTLQAVCDIKFDNLFVFKYSPRPQTKSYLMADNVSLEEKKRRHKVILEKSAEISSQAAYKMIGSQQEVLAHQYINGVLEARTSCNRKVFVKGMSQMVGSIFNVLIKEAKINALFGEAL